MNEENNKKGNIKELIKGLILAGVCFLGAYLFYKFYLAIGGNPLF